VSENRRIQRFDVMPCSASKSIDTRFESLYLILSGDTPRVAVLFVQKLASIIQALESFNVETFFEPVSSPDVSLNICVHRID
jgi:hypothetical protein